MSFYRSNHPEMSVLFGRIAIASYGALASGAALSHSWQLRAELDAHRKALSAADSKYLWAAGEFRKEQEKTESLKKELEEAKAAAAAAAAQPSSNRLMVAAVVAVGIAGLEAIRRC